MDPSRLPLAEHILNTIRAHLRLSVGVVQVTRPDGAQVWRIDASSPAGERWAAEDPDYYKAAVMLAELVGMEMEE